MQALKKLGHDKLILLLCVTVLLSYLPEAGEYSCFFVYLKLVCIHNIVHIISISDLPDTDRPHIDSLVYLFQVIIWNCNRFYKNQMSIIVQSYIRPIRGWFLAETFNHRKLMHVRCMYAFTKRYLKIRKPRFGMEVFVCNLDTEFLLYNE